MTVQARIDEITSALAVFVRPGQVSQLRALSVGDKDAVTRYFDGTHLEDAAKQVLQWESLGSKGIYFIPNPVRPDLLGARGSPKKADVIRRHWLLIDCDSKRPSETMANEAEREAAWRVLDRCRATLESRASVLIADSRLIAASSPTRFHGAVVADSGNGWHLCYPIDLPNDDGSQARVKALLNGLQLYCGDKLTKEEEAAVKAGRFLPSPKAVVDTKTFDAPRI